MYPHQQGGSAYDYSSYSTSPFEQQAPPAQAAGRTVRPGTSQTHSPQQADYPPSSSYTSSAPYSSAPYSIPSSHAQQWQPDSWAAQQYTSFTSQAMQTEMSYATATPRTDPPASISPPDTRVFPPTTLLSQTQEPRRQDSGYVPSLPASSHTSSPPRNRRRDKESPIVGPAPSTSSGLDFFKLQESYRFLLDGTNGLIANGAFTSSRPPPAETMDRMMQSANYGMQMLQSAVGQSNPDMRPVTTVVDKEAPTPKRQKGDEHAQEGQTCLGCNATSTPEWRRGPLGPRTLCNACGLVYAKLLKKRAREARSRAGDNGGQSSQHTMDETGGASSGGSEDEDSYGSQDRRSDFGDHGRRA
ncbi:hypothetical protein F5I97DRAFT_1149417 [Phlebopus sp. FC_14]|nr:hypothetical protein F5I97DRAFT_1149417 [Phlebopus sp. FC_14]